MMGGASVGQRLHDPQREAGSPDPAESEAFYGCKCESPRLHVCFGTCPRRREATTPITARISTKHALGQRALPDDLTCQCILNAIDLVHVNYPLEGI